MNNAVYKILKHVCRLLLSLFDPFSIIFFPGRILYAECHLSFILRY